jgi:hypothetical protein
MSLVPDIRAAIRTRFMRKQPLALEKLAPGQRPAAYQRTSECPRLWPSDQVFWVPWREKLVAPPVLGGLEHDCRLVA